MLKIMIWVYRVNPFRPHCGRGRHSMLCRLIVPNIPSIVCGEAKPPPDLWRKWQK